MKNVLSSLPIPCPKPEIPREEEGREATFFSSGVRALWVPYRSQLYMYPKLWGSIGARRLRFSPNRYIRNRLCVSQLVLRTEVFSNQEETDKFGASIGFPFKGVPVKLGFDSDNESSTRWYGKTCSQTSSSYVHNTAVHDVAQTASTSILAASTQCMNRAGLHVWIERTSDKKFVVAAKLVGPGRPTQVTIDEFKADHNVACDGTLAGRTINASTYRVPCGRKP